MTREEAIKEYVIPSLKHTWNEKINKEVLEALEQEHIADVSNMIENVNHPKHYNITGRKECIIEMIEKFGVDAVITFCILNAYKYRYRHELKNGQEDLEKAKWYENYALKLRDEKHKTADVIEREKIAQATNKIIKSSMGEWYVGRVDGKPDEVVLMDDVLRIMQELLQGG